MGKSNNSIQKLSFDSELFGYSVGKVNWDSSMDEEKFLIEAKDYQLVYIFSEKPLSFSSPFIHHTDTKITFEKKLPYREEETTGVWLMEDYIHNYGEQNLQETLYFLALESGQFSRFKVDSRLKNQEFEKLYRLWVQKSVDQGNVLIADDLAGMVTFDIKESFAQIGLIAVHPEHRRKSWGRKLVHTAENQVLSKGFGHLKISTQAANIPAMNLYQNMGYSISDKIWIYHFWKE